MKLQADGSITIEVRHSSETPPPVVEKETRTVGEASTPLLREKSGNARAIAQAVGAANAASSRMA